MERDLYDGQALLDKLVAAKLAGQRWDGESERFQYTFRSNEQAALAAWHVAADFFAPLLEDREDAHREAGQAVAAVARVTALHRRFNDDGVTYCGWDGRDGCGELWPCTTIRALDGDGPAEEGDRG